MRWDFALILLFFATVVPILGRRRIRQLMRTEKTTKADRLSLYASTAIFQWLSAALILWRTTARGIAPSALAIAVPKPGLTLIVSILLAALILTNQFVSLRRLAQAPSKVQGILPKLAAKVFPQDHAERLAFFGLVVTVSICEELIYRGFAQRVFQDFSGDIVAAGIIGSALLFGLAHIYQGRRGFISTLLVGALFSWVRAWTGSLIPTVVAHFAADFTAGLLAPSKLRAAGAQPANGLAKSETQGRLILYV
ncbi:MAG TPA: type II CAAX endopeptidase family protein [Candidatus Acidoferrales bacterium]|nr:type II CAAX endopeptidase family protein [Candidatus Acidoferrales bacterium]